MTKKRSLLLVGVILVALLFSSCNGNAIPSTSAPTVSPGNLQVNETSVSEGTVAEPILINNCGNPAFVEQVSEHSQTITVEVGAELGFDAKVVRGSVEGKYISTKGVTKSQKVIAAPHTNMRFILLWTEKVSEGTVTVDNHSGLATYRVSVPISVEQVSADNLGCYTPEPTTYASPTTTTGPGSGSPTEAVVSLPTYSCATVNELPQENARLKRGQSFKVNFTVVNNGDTVWPENLTLDIVSNPFGTVYAPSLPMRVPRVQPGDYIVVGAFDAKAPGKEGHYVVSFQIGNGFCRPYIAFDVIR